MDLNSANFKLNPREPKVSGPLPPFTALNSRFIKRTVLATLITLALVAATAAVYWKPTWAGIYFFTGIWTLGFLALTPLIMKAFLFDRNLLLGLLWTAGKLVWLALMIFLCLRWGKSALNPLMLKSALVCGVTTPIVVVFLRGAGIALEQRGESER